MPKGLINTSDELRKLIIHRSERFNISLLHICAKLGIDYRFFVMTYANAKNLRDKQVIYSDVQLMEMAEILGITVRSIFVVKDDKDFEENVEQLKETLKYDFNTAKEKRASKRTK